MFEGVYELWSRLVCSCAAENLKTSKLGFGEYDFTLIIIFCDIPFFMQSSFFLSLKRLGAPELQGDSTGPRRAVQPVQCAP